MTALLTLGVSGAWADGLKVSTTESASAEYQYKIFCRNASTYYLGNTTNATNSGADYGLFAFFADNSGDYTNGYYIYSIFEGKWVTYTAAESYSGGKNKISLVADKPSVPWNIAADDTDSKYYDIRPFQTDKTVADMSWNWHAGPSANTSNTMGFYSYTDVNSGWGFVLAGGSGSTVADRKVVALYNVPKDDQLYPLYKSGNDVKISNLTEATPQYFVLRQNGLDPYGEALYRIMRAECDNNYLTYQSFGTSESNYMFVNTASWFIANDQRYTYGTTSGYTPADAPYYNMFNKTGSDSYASMVAECVDNKINRYTGAHGALPCPYSDPGANKWNARWKITELAGYTAWQVVMSGATSGTVTYSGSSLISGGTATQSHNGMFVLSATPSASDFTASVVDGYLTDPAVTIDSDRKIIKVVYTNYSETYNTIVTKLSTAPEGVGYPTTTARTRLQAAIDVFDASSKVTADLATLNTAYTSFLTNVVLPEGKVYTIQNYIKSNSLTTYLKNEDGTLTIGADASATPLNNLWIVRKSGNTYVLQSAADLTKYIVYTSFTLAASGSEWTLSQGTEWPYISMYNSSLGGGRYVACNGSNQFGTAGEGGYYGQYRTQSNGWSTDFKFVESPDYKLYKVKIIYPQGSAPTVTYSGNAYANGSDFVASTTLTTGDLTVSTISGYTPSVTIDGDVIYVYYDMAVAAPYADTWNFDNSPWSLLNDAPAAIDNPSRTYRYNTKRINIATTYNSSVEVVFAYIANSGSYRIDVAGVDLIDPSTGNVVKGDYHDGYSGDAQSNKEYSIRDVAPGEYILRYISYGQSTSSAGNISVRVVPGQGFYRLKNVATDKYLTATATGAWNSSTRGVYANGSSTDASTVIRLFDKDSNGKLYMYNQGYGFGWTATNHGGGVGWITDTPDKYVNWFPGNSAGQIAFAICFGNGIGDYASYLEKGIYTVDTEDNAVIAGSDYTDNKAQWVLEAASSVTIPLSGAIQGKSYGTYSAPFDVTIGDDAKAYTVELNDDRAVYTEIVSKQIPAGAGVLLISETAASSVTATINTGEPFATLADNNLNGYYLATSFSYPDETTNWNLVLGNSTTSGIGFYKMNGTASANKAYLPYPHVAGTSVKGFSLVAGDEVDGIQSIDIEQTNAPIFNLAGQRVQKVQRGLYIIGGKKVIVK